MRKTLDKVLLDEVLKELGRLARGPGKVYLTGGACALIYGWRESTVDLDLRLDPEPRGVFEGIRTLKQCMDVNIELASPSDFIPEVPGWRERSVFISTHGQVSFFHYDFYAQALAKLERGHGRDLHDVEKMCADGLVERQALLDYFEQIAPNLMRYPALDEDGFRGRVESFINASSEEE